MLAARRPLAERPLAECPLAGRPAADCPAREHLARERSRAAPWLAGQPRSRHRPPAQAPRLSRSGPRSSPLCHPARKSSQLAPADHTEVTFGHPLPPGPASASRLAPGPPRYRQVWPRPLPGALVIMYRLGRVPTPMPETRSGIPYPRRPGPYHVRHAGARKRADRGMSRSGPCASAQEAPLHWPRTSLGGPGGGHCGSNGTHRHGHPVRAGGLLNRAHRRQRDSQGRPDSSGSLAGFRLDRATRPGETRYNQVERGFDRSWMETSWRLGRVTGYW